MPDFFLASTYKHKAGHRQTIVRILELATDRHFLDLSEIRFYTIYEGLMKI